jgi:hypothetical protein
MPFDKGIGAAASICVAHAGVRSKELMSPKQSHICKHRFFTFHEKTTLSAFEESVSCSNLVHNVTNTCCYCQLMHLAYCLCCTFSATSVHDALHATVFHSNALKRSCSLKAVHEVVRLLLLLCVSHCKDATKAVQAKHIQQTAM